MVEQEEQATQARRRRVRKGFIERDGTKTTLSCQLDSKDAFKIKGFGVRRHHRGANG